MMLYLYVLQNQWIAITLLSAVALLLVFFLTYQAMWLPREAESKSETTKVKDLRTFYQWVRGFLPWVILLIMLGSVAFTIATLLAKTGKPPNW